MLTRQVLKFLLTRRVLKFLLNRQAHVTYSPCSPDRSMTPVPPVHPTGLSGRIGKVVASHAAVARLIPAQVALTFTMHEALRRYYP